MADNIIFQPTEKQSSFLSSTADELCFGGGAGSGKSYAMLIDALGLNQKKMAILCSDYTALIIRKTYKELSDLIRTSYTLYPKIDKKATFNKSKNTWTFNSGAQLIFGNCDTDDAVYQYQGMNITYVGIEEIGQFDSDFVYQYLKSRLRTTNPDLKCYIRATCNPSKYPWLRDYFKINVVGDSTKRTETTTTSNGLTKKRTIQFISARLIDNPYLYQNGEYETMLMSLPEQERNALLFGRWDSYTVKGAIYSDKLEEMRNGKRICKVNKDSNLTVYCVFDLGRNDTNPIIFAQSFGREVRIFDHYENNGNHISHYFDYIQQKKFISVKIVLPHDAKAKTVGAEYSVEEQAITAFGSSNVIVLPREDIELGISEAKKMMDSDLYISEECVRLLECLENYKRKYNASMNIYEGPIHDVYSNSADAFRYLAMCLKSTDNTKQLDTTKLRPQMMQMTPW